MSTDFSQKTVLLGVTGCIAAYKSAEIVRSLQKVGVRVKVVMTEHACEFIGPTTFRALTHEPVATGLFDDPCDPIHHISLAQEADLFLIAPCTANVMAKLTQGIADDILTTTALATTAPLLVAPAMNVNMYETDITVKNMVALEERGVHFVEADEGYLACGDVGRGKLAPVETIVAAALELLGTKRDLEGKRVLITAGPTQEALDPVRYLTNHSSGKMGYALARIAAQRGAEVILVSGPVDLAVPRGVEVVSVKTAEEMLEASKTVFGAADIAIFSAAVSDMRPKHPAAEKLKKGSDDASLTSLELVPNPDILATLAAGKTPDQFVVGFAAETNNLINNAQGKLSSKHADLIVANDVSQGQVFGKDTNKVFFIEASGVTEVPEMTKTALATHILSKALSTLE